MDYLFDSACLVASADVTHYDVLDQHHLETGQQRAVVQS